MPARLRTRLALATALGAALLGHPAAAQDASELVVRLGRIENQSRIMAGQIETLQYENRQLKEQLRKFQEDVEFRLNEGKGEGKGGGKPAPAAAPSSGPAGTWMTAWATPSLAVTSEAGSRRLPRTGSMPPAARDRPCAPSRTRPLTLNPRLAAARATAPP